MLLRHRQNVVRGARTLDHVLHGRALTRTGRGQSPLSLKSIVCLLLICGATYGSIMGSYAAVAGLRSWSDQLEQMFYSAIKLPLLITFTVVLALPGFLVLNTLAGLRRDFGLAIRAIASAQAGLVIILASLAPITLLTYISLGTDSAGYNLAVLLNALFFGLASVLGQLILRRFYQQLIRKNPRHRFMLWIWIVLYAFVGIQAGYLLRPFIGSPDRPIAFFREAPFENAYVRIVKLLWQLLL